MMKERMFNFQVFLHATGNDVFDAWKNVKEAVIADPSKLGDLPPLEIPKELFREGFAEGYADEFPVGSVITDD